MPKRTDISSILLLGSGPIVIGQGAEFDYSGTQAVRALKEEGYRVILVNSNPATIMTDPELADATYIEPVTPEGASRPSSTRWTCRTSSPPPSRLTRCSMAPSAARCSTSSRPTR